MPIILSIFCKKLNLSNAHFLNERRVRHLFSIIITTAILNLFVNDAQAKLNPEVCAALPDAAGMPAGPNRGVIDDFGAAPSLTPAVANEVLNILYTAFANLLKTTIVTPSFASPPPATTSRPAKIYELATIAEAILKAGGSIPPSALTYLSKNPVIVSAIINDNNTSKKPLIIKALVTTLGIALTAAQTKAAASFPLATFNPIQYAYNHMRDVRHLWQIPAGVIGGALDEHYFAWCRAARTATGFDFPSEHSSFAFSVTGLVPLNPNSAFLAILNAINLAAQNPNNIIAVDKVQGESVDILVNVGNIAGINVIKCDLNPSGYLQNITDNAVNVIAKTTIGLISPSPLIPKAPGGFTHPNLVPATITSPILPSVASTTFTSPIMAAAAATTTPLLENCACPAALAVYTAVTTSSPTPTSVTGIGYALRFPIINIDYDAKIPSNIEYAAEAAATMHQASHTLNTLTSLGGAVAIPFLSLQVPVALPVAWVLPTIPAAQLIDVIATVGLAPGVPPMPTMAAGAVTTAMLADANALPTLPTTLTPTTGVSTALSLPAGSIAKASSSQQVGVVAIRISSEGKITSVFPK